MKKVLLFARDPGGANTLIPLYDKLKEKYEVVVYGKDVAIKWFQNEGICCNDIKDICEKIDFESVYLFLRKMLPDFIITGTSLDDYTERYLWKSAEILGIKSFAILDQWVNMGIRFSKYSYKEIDLYKNEKMHTYMPYRILVMDEMAKDMIQKEGIEEKRIYVTGQPHFETISKKYAVSEKIFDNQKWNILFVSEPIRQDYENNMDSCEYCGYNEKIIFLVLYECLNILAEKYQKKVRLIIKPHPRENTRDWENIVDTYKNGNIELYCSMEDEKYSLLKSADLVCGMSSMMLLEAAICKKNILSIMVGLKKENPFILDKLNICKTCLTKETLLQRLENNLIFKKEKMFFKYIENAVSNVIRYIEEEV